MFSFFNTVIYCIPAGWVWGDQGFLKRLGTVDIAGSGAVHLVGNYFRYVITNEILKNMMKKFNVGNHQKLFLQGWAIQVHIIN